MMSNNDPSSRRRTVGKPRINAFHTGLSEPLGNALAPQNAPRQAPLGPRPDMLRSDGSQKGQGYLGPLKNALGQSMTEYSIGVEFDGKETDIPTMVPTLTPQEIEYILNMQDGMRIPPSIEQKAADHALMRMRQGLSPFHDSGPAHTRRRF